MKKALFSFLFLAFSVVAQPPWFPYGIPIGGSNESGDVVICDSSCQSSIGGGEGILYKPDQSTITSLPHGAVGQVLQSRGQGLPPVFTNPASIQAFVYGPSDSLVSNPQLANQAAKFIRVTDTIRIVAGSDFASDPVLVDGTSRYVEVVQAPGITEYTAGTSAAGDLRGIAHGAGLYVRVGLGGLIETSPDLVTWTSRTSGTVQDLNSVIWDGTRFIAVGAAGWLTYSSDGFSWTAYQFGDGVTANAITYLGGDRYVIAGNANGTRYCDGDPTVSGNWSLASGGQVDIRSMRTITVNDAGDVLIAGNSSILRSVTSGETYVTMNQPGVEFQSILHIGGNVVLAAGGGGVLYRSANSTVNGSFIPVTSGTSESLRLMAANERVYTFGGNGASRQSTDNGVTWQAGPPSGVTSFLRFGMSDPANPTRAIVVGDGGTMLVGQFPVVISAYDTPQNRTDKKGLGIYEYDTGASAAGDLRGIAHGAGVYARVGLGGLIETSPDLVTWTTRTSGVSVTLNFVIYDSHTAKFWAVGASGTLLSSSDGITWSPVSLPVDVATDNLTGIATDGAGVFVVSNGTYGQRALRSSDGGATFAMTSGPGGSQDVGTVAFDGTYFFMPRTSSNFYLASSADLGLTFSNMTIPLAGGTALRSFVVINGVRIVAGTSGVIATSPVGSDPTLEASWTFRTSGTTEELRLMVANGRVYAVGQNGISLESSDNGETWVAGPAVGTTDFMRFGMSDPVNPTRAIVVGSGSTMLIGQFPVVATTYPELPDSILLLGSASFDLDALAPADLPLNIDVLRQFNSTAYASTADRSAGTSPLGNAFYTYSETPLVVTIPGQLTFQIGILTPGEVPFDFDVVTIDDMIYNLFVVQNSALNPGPYYGWNAVYDFGVDDRFEFGAESDNEYATLIIQDSDTGDWFVKKSNAPGDAGDPITWVDAFIIRGNGAVSIPSLGVGSGAVCHTAGVLSECP